jgi:hypothetical protein
MIFDFIIALGVGEIAKSAFKIYSDKRKVEIETSSERFQKAIENINDGYAIMNDILVVSNASRVSLLKTTNGGGVPRIGCPIYGTMVYEIYRNGKPNKKNWSNIEIDKEYIKLLSNIIREKKVVLKTENLKIGLLENINHQLGIVKSLVFYLNAKSTEFLYLSIDYDNDAEINEGEIEMLINQFRGLIKNGL